MRRTSRVGKIAREREPIDEPQQAILPTLRTVGLAQCADNFAMVTARP
jgi:hypothetical protein